MIISFVNLILFLTITFLSLHGYGLIISTLFSKDNFFINNYKTLNLIFGLILVGSLSILISFFSNLSNIICFSVIIFGILISIINLIYLKYKNFELRYLFIIIFISLVFSFYSLGNDDFSYHLQTIVLFKENIVFDIIHSRQTSYNSFWLIISSLLYIDFFPQTLFTITSLLYSSLVFDIYSSLKRNFKNKNNLLIVYTFTNLLFLLGVINNYQNFGTDFPGQILIILIFVLFFESSFYLKDKYNSEFFFIILILSILSFLIKISNGLIFLLLLVIFFKVRKSIQMYILIILASLPIFLWGLQNYLKSSCLIWPLAITCFENILEAEEEITNITLHAKSVWGYGISGDFSGFKWIPVWIERHSYKLIETYGIFILLLSISGLLIIIFNKSVVIKKSKDKILNRDYFIFLLLSLIFSIVWFFNSPAYRFGIIFNLNTLLIFIIPLWIYCLNINFKVSRWTINILLSLSLLFFSYHNFYYKYHKYFERLSNTVWPNIVNNQYIHNQKFEIK